MEGRGKSIDNIEGMSGGSSKNPDELKMERVLYIGWGPRRRDLNLEKDVKPKPHWQPRKAFEQF